MKTIRESGYFEIEKKTVKALRNTRYTIPIGDDSIVEVNEKDKTVSYIANLVLTVETGNGESEEFLLKTNKYLPMSFNSYSKNGSNHEFTIDGGQYLFKNNLYVKNVMSAGAVFGYVLRGKLESPYSTADDVIRGILEDNGIVGHQSLGYEVYVTETSRNPEKTAETMRHQKTDIHDEDYLVVGIREITRSHSAMSSLNNEDIVASVKQAVIATRDGVKPELTPLEVISLGKYKKL